jgi:hypothetical protein
MTYVYEILDFCFVYGSSRLDRQWAVESGGYCRLISEASISTVTPYSPQYSLDVEPSDFDVRFAFVIFLVSTIGSSL